MEMEYFLVLTSLCLAVIDQQYATIARCGYCSYTISL